MFQSEISKEEVADLDLIQYEGPIRIIDSREEFKEEITNIREQGVLGFDTETRPSFKKGVVYPTSLIQLSSLDQAWLLRMNNIGYPKELLELFTREDVPAVDVSLRVMDVPGSSVREVRVPVFGHRE